MPHFKATPATGDPVEYDADAPLPEHLTEGWRLESISEAYVSPDAEPEAYAGSWKITKFAFRSRFTTNEKIAIEIASLDNPSADMQARGFAAALRANQGDIAVAQFVDLQLQATREGVMALEQFGLIAEGRALEILDTAPTDEEVWNG